MKKEDRKVERDIDDEAIKGTDKYWHGNTGLEICTWYKCPIGGLFCRSCQHNQKTDDNHVWCNFQY